jgi:hypothetical protein
MSRKMEVLLSVVMAAALLLGMALPARAQADRIPVSSYEYDCFTGVETEWAAGQVYHMRNVGHTNINVSSSPELNGVNTTIADAEFNLSTGYVVIRGTMSFKPDGIDGTWEGSWQFISNNGVLKGTAVGHGTGELFGKTLFLNIYDAPYDPVIETMCAGIGAPEGIVVTEGYILGSGAP